MMVLPSPSLGASSTQHNIYTAHTIAQKSTDKYLVGARGSSKAEDQMSAKNIADAPNPTKPNQLTLYRGFNINIINMLQP
jgi:hypothetical protein